MSKSKHLRSQHLIEWQKVIKMKPNCKYLEKFAVLFTVNSLSSRNSKGSSHKIYRRPEGSQVDCVSDVLYITSTDETKLYLMKCCERSKFKRMGKSTFVFQ